MSATQRQNLIEDYAATSLAFSAAVQRLRIVQTDVEKFIAALAEVGTAHRACQRSRLRFSKHLRNGQDCDLPRSFDRS